jgi:hypothetical protein
MATKLVGSFTGTGQSAAADIDRGSFGVTIGQTGTTLSGTVRLERSADDGATYTTVSIDGAGTAASWTSDAYVVVEEVVGKSSGGRPAAKYRLNCTAFTSGPIYYRIEQ